MKRLTKHFRIVGFAAALIVVAGLLAALAWHHSTGFTGGRQRQEMAVSAGTLRQSSGGSGPRQTSLVMAGCGAPAIAACNPAHTSGTPHPVTAHPEERVATSVPLDFLNRILSADEMTATIPLPDGGTAMGEVTSIQRDGNGLLLIQGKVKDPEAGKFMFQRQTAPGTAGPMVGYIHYDKSDVAYRVRPNGINGSSMLVQDPVDEVVCRYYPAAAQTPEEAPQTHPTNYPIPPDENGIVQLQSLPGATAVVYLDFDGEADTFPGWGYINAAPSGATNAEIFEVWKGVAEDYIPFNINITTVRAVYDAAPSGGRMHVMLTPTSTAAPGAGGVAYVGSFNYTGHWICWSFYTTGKSAVEVVSHEVGHTLGLSHDGRISPVEGYYAGHNGWAPIMGVGYYQTISQWSKGEYPSANNTEDDLSIIVSNNNAVDYRVDDHGATYATATWLDIASGGSVSNEGTIETCTDEDSFRFATTGGNVTLSIHNVTFNPNLDIKAEIVNAVGIVIATSDSDSTEIASFSALNFAAGDYFLRVSGVGKGDLSTGYSDYGSLGSYLISGTVNGGAAANHFTLEENSGNTTIVGSVTPRVSHGAGTLVYAISSGNTGGTFAINPATGAITVANSATLDFEMLSTHWDDPASFELFVSITDSLGMATESIRTVVTILNVNEAPVLAPLAAQAIWASLPPGSLLATASAVDPDREDYVSFSIAAGNTGNAFVIDSATGAITVAGPLDFLTTPAYTLTVRATDHGTPVRTADCQLAISQAAPAATLDWNNGSSNGLWDTTSTSWLNGSTPAIWNNAAPDSAVFSDTAVGTITLTTGISASGMDFTTTGYSIIGNTLTLASERASPVVNVTGISTIISSVIAGTNGFTKTGAGTLTLRAMNSFTGTMKVSAGIVEINNAPEWGRGFSGANTTVEIDSGASVKLNIPWALGYTNTCDDLTIHDGGMLNCNSWTSYVRHIVLEGSADISGTSANEGVVLSGNLTTTPTDAAAPQLQQLRLSGASYGVVGGTTLFTVHDNVNQAADLTIGQIGEGSTAALTKAGAGTMFLTDANNYTGLTTVSEGTLVVHGSLAAGGVTVNSGATLGGNGILNGPVVIQSGGTLTTDPSGISTLRISNTLTLAGDTLLRIHSGSVTSDCLNGMTGVTYGGSLTVMDLGRALAVDQKFTLFTKASGTYAGSFATLNLPTPPTGLEWNTSGLAMDGSIQLLKALTQVAAPSFLPAAGNYSVPVSVTIGSETGSEIYYTTNGDTPTVDSEHGPSPVSGIIVPLGTQMAIKTFATKTGMANSVVASAVYSTLPTAVWLNPTGGSWTHASNWLSQIIASGLGTTADFSTLDLTTNATVTLDSAPTIGTLIFGDTTPSHSWTLQTGGPLTLDHGIATPVIEVKNQLAMIGVAIAGTNGFTKIGAGTLILDEQNSFTGTMKVSGGTVEINNATEWGNGFAGANTTVEVDSGATVKFNTVWALGFTTICDDLIIHDGGALNCNGQTTYVRHMVLEGSAHISNNTQVDSNISLSGNLTATPTDATAPQLQLFRLSGSAYGVVGGTSTFTVNDNANQPVDLTVGPIFQSSTAALVKAGAGTMLMTGANSYTGSTRVNSGTLFLTGSISTGTVTVNANATLGGTGTINSTTTIADKGRLAFTLSTLAASHDPLNITGALVFSGASVLDITPSGVLPAPGTYPLVIAAAPITGSVPATLNLPTGWVATVSISADTLSLLLNVTSTGSNTYDTWSSGTFANAFTDHDPTHDPDRDGLTNLLEYAFGTDPTVSTGGEIVYDGTSVTRPGGPKFVEDGGMYYAVFGRRAGYLSAGILYTVRFSADLRAGYWTTSAIEPIALTRTGGIHAVRVPYPIELVPSGNGPQKARFFQVVVTQTP